MGTKTEIKNKVSKHGQSPVPEQGERQRVSHLKKGDKPEIAAWGAEIKSRIGEALPPCSRGQTSRGLPSPPRSVLLKTSSYVWVF